VRNLQEDKERKDSRCQGTVRDDDWLTTIQPGSPIVTNLKRLISA
jgi:hypothetical protein